MDVESRWLQRFDNYECSLHGKTRIPLIMPYGIPDTAFERIRRTLSQHRGVTRVILYGSRAKGTYQNGSDIDITLEGDGLSFDDLLRIESQLDALDLPYRFDVSLHDELTHPDLLQHIQRVGREILNLQSQGKAFEGARP